MQPKSPDYLQTRNRVTSLHCDGNAIRNSVFDSGLEHLTPCRDLIPLRKKITRKVPRNRLCLLAISTKMISNFSSEFSSRVIRVANKYHVTIFLNTHLI